MNSKIEEYDHVANDRDASKPDCDICGEGIEVDVQQCKAPRCDCNVCDLCRGNNEVFEELGVCSETCAVEVIGHMRFEIEQLRKANRSMQEALEFIKQINPDQFEGERRDLQYARALGTAQGRAIHASAWGKVA